MLEKCMHCSNPPVMCLGFLIGNRKRSPKRKAKIWREKKCKYKGKIGWKQQHSGRKFQRKWPLNSFVGESAMIACALHQGPLFWRKCYGCLTGSLMKGLLQIISESTRCPKTSPFLYCHQKKKKKPTFSQWGFSKMNYTIKCQEEN